MRELSLTESAVLYMMVVCPNITYKIVENIGNRYGIKPRTFRKVIGGLVRDGFVNVVCRGGVRKWEKSNRTGYEKVYNLSYKYFNQINNNITKNNKHIINSNGEVEINTFNCQYIIHNGKVTKNGRLLLDIKRTGRSGKMLVDKPGDIVTEKFIRQLARTNKIKEVTNKELLTNQIEGIETR